MESIAAVVDWRLNRLEQSDRAQVDAIEELKASVHAIEIELAAMGVEVKPKGITERLRECFQLARSLMADQDKRRPEVSLLKSSSLLKCHSKGGIRAAAIDSEGMEIQILKPRLKHSVAHAHSMHPIVDYEGLYNAGSAADNEQQSFGEISYSDYQSVLQSGHALMPDDMPALVRFDNAIRHPLFAEPSRQLPSLPPRPDKESYSRRIEDLMRMIDPALAE